MIGEKDYSLVLVPDIAGRTFLVANVRRAVVNVYAEDSYGISLIFEKIEESDSVVVS